MHKRLHFLGDKYKPVVLPVKQKIGEEDVNVQITPTIEIQYKTFAVKAISETGSASHMAYKGKTIQKIKELQESGFRKGITIPRMWTINDSGELYELEAKQVVRKMYPFLYEPKEEEREEIK